MSEKTNAKLLRVYRSEVVAGQNVLADMLEDVILERMDEKKSAERIMEAEDRAYESGFRAGKAECDHGDCAERRRAGAAGGDTDVDEPSEIRAVSDGIADMLREMDAESDGDGTCPNDVPTPSITDELREMDNGHSRTCPKSGDEVSESAPSVSIVDELRECVETATKTYDDTAWYEVDDEDEHTWCSITVAEIDGIADRIEEQFARVCQQQEAVLLKQMDQQRAMLTEQRDAARAKVIALCNECDRLKRAADRDADHIESLSGAYNDMERERDELQAKLDELEKFDADTSLAAFGDDNDELRRLLSRAAKLLANAEQDRDANYAYWMDCKEKVVHANTTIEELQAKLDGIKSVLATDETEVSDVC